MVGNVDNSIMSSLTSLADTFITFIDGIVHRASHYALYIGYNIYILMTLYMYCPVWDVMVGSMCTMVI